jgi:DNA polymerase III subunit epsilon
MILAFDTETTGLIEKSLPLDHAAQPHLVQIAALLLEEDGTEHASFSLIVRPPIPIPDEATATHGITNGLAAAAGISPAAAVGIWSNLARRADTVVAHNLAFDWQLMQIAWGRTQAPSSSFERVHGDRMRQFCTMRAALPIVNLPPTAKMLAAGFNRPKPPKLSECIQHFFGEELIGAHDALVDVRACARVFFHLRSMERAAA